MQKRVSDFESDEYFERVQSEFTYDSDCLYGNFIFRKVADRFEHLASAVLIFALACGRLGLNRTYLNLKNSTQNHLDDTQGVADGINKVTNRRALLVACSELLDSLDITVHFYFLLFASLVWVYEGGESLFWCAVVTHSCMLSSVLFKMFAAMVTV